jgi:hypothetical protein
MNIIFPYIKLYYSILLQFTFALSKNSIKWNKLKKYSKKSTKCAKFDHVVQGIIGGLQKILEGQNKKKQKNFA